MIFYYSLFLKSTRMNTHLAINFRSELIANQINIFKTATINYYFKTKYNYS